MTPTTSSSFTIGDTIVVPWRPERPVKVTSTMYEAVYRLRAATIIAARRRSTITYGEAELAIDGLYVAQGLGPALDLLSYDCEARGEPSLAALVVRKDSGKVGDGFVGDAELGREECYEHWRRK
jgi:hypothetical protein